MSTISYPPFPDNWLQLTRAQKDAWLAANRIDEVELLPTAINYGLGEDVGYISVRPDDDKVCLMLCLFDESYGGERSVELDPAVLRAALALMVKYEERRV